MDRSLIGRGVLITPLFGPLCRSLGVHPTTQLISGLFLPVPPRTYLKRTGSQLRAMRTRLSLNRKFQTCSRRAWSASIRDVVNSIGDAGSTRPG